MAKSIPGYCVSFTGYENNTFSYVLMYDANAGIGSDTVDYCDIDFSGITISFLMANLDSGSSYISTQGWYKLIVDTTEGSFVMRSGNLSLSSSVTSIQTKSFTLSGGSYSLPGAFVSIRIEGSYFITMLNGSSTYYYQFSSATINGWSKVDVQGSGSDYSVILTKIYNELVDQGLTLDNLYSELLDQGISLDTLVKSLCFDFPHTIDSNYYLSTCFLDLPTNSSLNNSVFDLGFFAFDFNPHFNIDVCFRVPSSHKVMFVSSINSNNNCFLGNWSYNGSSISISSTSRFSSSEFGYFYYYDLPSSLPTGALLNCSIYTGGTSFIGRCALYEYRVSANDILDYMESQWGQVTPNVPGTDTIIGDTDTLVQDWSTYETQAFTDLDTAYAQSGISGFAWSGFTGIQAYTSIVDQFYNVLPSEVKLFIIAGLIIGITAVILSAVGRVVRNSDKFNGD